MSSLENIKLLREKTGAGLGACKQALAECNNDVEAAVTFLRKKGLADMAKRAGRETKEGRVSIKVSEDGNTVAMAYLGCETDFVAKTADFIGRHNQIYTESFLSRYGYRFFYKSPHITYYKSYHI